ncbi:hypothetical protein ASE74_13980 [Pedobacter sp. Leaf216]|nr:hypothetical protein ASE74_13980 [Pedobacter sp. Leaf216]
MAASSPAISSSPHPMKNRVAGFSFYQVYLTWVRGSSEPDQTSQVFETCEVYSARNSKISPG